MRSYGRGDLELAELAVVAEVVGGEAAIRLFQALKSGLHFTALVEAVALGIDGENSKILLGKVSGSVFKEEGKWLFFFADARCPFNGVPAACPASAIFRIVIAEIV